MNNNRFGRLLLALTLMILLLAPALPAYAAGQEASTEPLLITGVAVSNIGYSGAVISWQTNAAATSQVFYGTAAHADTADYTRQTTVDTSLVLSHSVSLTGLAPGTTYHFRVRSVFTGDGESIAVSLDYTFVTPALPPEEPPPPTTPLPPGTADVSGMVTAGGRFTGPVVVTSEDGLAGLTIPEDTTGLTGDGQPLTLISIVPLPEPPPPPPQAELIGPVYDFEPHGATFDPPLILTLHYNPADLPPGFDEESLVIAYYDDQTGLWVELESVVDSQNNTITVRPRRFMSLAVIGYEPLPPESPAVLTVTGLTVTPTHIYVGNAVTVIVVVTNSGGQTGSYNVILNIDGVVADSREVTVDPGRNQEASFSVIKNISGVYTVTVASLNSSFTVTDLPVPPPADEVNWPLIGGIIAAVAVAGFFILFLLKRRRHEDEEDQG
ncbi:hypothetical protein DGWBC_0565 [Dehalogenimonas sp. WBC-2]|nr:hypothetical protein DGWBC_0565 [Dehalogenimonas sp. WBC-2]